jgi:hypothetical protein
MYPDFQASMPNMNRVAPFTRVLSTSTKTSTGPPELAD